MNLSDYFDPVSLEKPELHLLNENLTFSRSLFIHTANTPLKSLERYDLAIVGIPEDKNAFIPGSASAPDLVRGKLYQLSSINRKIKIIDLGNLKITGNINDTYYALRDITMELRSKDIVIVYIGGSQDLTWGINMAFEKANKSYTLGSIDARIDFGFKDKKISSASYLDHIIKGKKSPLFNFFNIGHQTYFSHLKIIDQLEKRGYECVRLGTARSDMLQVEPSLRDASFVSVDMACVRQSDAPGVTLPSPNGFFGHELCQLARYAGTSTHIEGFGIFELLPVNDINEQTSHLAAQVIWYFLEGYSLKLREKGDQAGNKKYHINLHDTGHDLIFYRSLKTDRWWMELPYINKNTGERVLVSCTYSDYQQAGNQEIPDRWWKACSRFGD